MNTEAQNVAPHFMFSEHSSAFLGIFAVCMLAAAVFVVSDD